MQTGYITSSYVPQNDEELAQGIPITTGIIKPTKPKFISDVLTIVFLQLSISTSTSVIGYHYKESLIKYIKNDPGFFYLPLILSFMSLISLSCCNLNKCAKYSMFIVFTLSMSSSITIVILPYSSAIVLQSFCVTGVSVLVINICAWISAKKNINFIGYSSFIFSMLATLLVLSLFQIFIHSTIMESFITFLGVFVFTLYLLYDLNLLYNREYDEFDPIMVAIDIYLDIINMFLYILQCISGSSSDN